MKDQLFEKSILTLELPQVLELLSAEAATDEGKERAMSLRPFTHPEDVRRALEETSAAVDMVSLRGAPYFGGVKPVRASLQRADMGGALNTRELLEVAAVLRCARSCIEYAADSREKTPLDPRKKPLPILFPASHKPDSNVLCAAAAQDTTVMAFATNARTPKDSSPAWWLRGRGPAASPTKLNMPGVSRLGVLFASLLYGAAAVREQGGFIILHISREHNRQGLFSGVPGA